MRIVWLEPAVEDLRRLREFIANHNPDSARRASQLIRSAVALLESTPNIGKPVEDLPGFHDIVIPYGAAGYVLRYRTAGDIVCVVAVRHGKEAGFRDISHGSADISRD